MAYKSFGDAELKSGIPRAYMQAVQTAANMNDCVIACRYVGKSVTGLLEAGYATKSIAVHSKSCDWGPMAGFVCADARFTKKSNSLADIREQRAEVKNQRILAGPPVPIKISRQRVDQLRENRQEWGMYDWVELNNEIKIRASKAGIQYTFTVAGISGHPGMYDISVHDRYGTSKVCAFTNPGPVTGNHLAALTGDLDLWGVFARNEVRADDPRSHKRFARTGKIQQHRKANLGKKIKSAFDNSTSFVNAVIRGINNAANYPTGNLVQHGDELGRPNMRRPELPFIAFFPKQDNYETGGVLMDPPWIVDKGTELDEFYNELFKRGFYVEFNRNWKQLVD